MIRQHIKGFIQFVNETVEFNGKPYTSSMLYQYVLDGKKDILFLVRSDQKYIDNSEDLQILEDARKRGFGEIPVRNRTDGEAWIIYHNNIKAKRKAERLEQIASEKNGYLQDTTPEEAREIGELLDYSSIDINTYIKRRYGNATTYI